ncbi:hypothetical protein AAFF_G00015540 [Aldrovandia affinis]|uniref:Uncharacterized protein n=1 Tax=Aldrovandia affinis TaxID=143900 RepID=A0AAD7WGZ1_9TELE|nr:hypothetical protein AAFF_G00015540 [Aldrovandia affinis]
MKQTYTPIKISIRHHGYFGKVSMRHYHHLFPTANLDKLWMLVSEQTSSTTPGNQRAPPPSSSTSSAHDVNWRCIWSS